MSNRKPLVLDSSGNTEQLQSGDVLLLESDAISNNLTSVVELLNNTASTSGTAVQNPPMILSAGSAWDTGATASKGMQWRQYFANASGSPISSTYGIQASINGGSTWTSVFAVDNLGNATVYGNGTIVGNLIVDNNLTVNGSLAVALNAGGYNVTNLADPMNPQDAATMNWVQNQFYNWDIKLAVRACAQGNLAFTRSGNTYTANAIGVLTKATIDAGWSTGASLAVGDRILLANQTSNVDNGIVVVTSLGTIGTDAVLTRATDMSVSADVVSEMRVPVSEGTDANLDYKLSAAGTFTLNTTGLPFTKAGGPPTGAAGGALGGTYPNPTVGNAATATKLATARAINGVNFDGSGAINAPYIGLIMLEDQKTSGTGGGAFSSGSWVTRVLNTKTVDTNSDCTLTSNTFTLTAGTYEIWASAPAGLVNAHQIRLWNTTDGAAVNDVTSGTPIIGTGEYATSGGGVITRSFLQGRFTIAASKALAIQHQCGTTSANTEALGAPCSFGTEVYAQVKLIRVV